MAYTGCALDFLVTKRVFGGRASTKVETYPKKTLTKSLQNPLPNPLVLVHQCHTSSLENHLVNLCFQKDTFVKTYKIYIYMHVHEKYVHFLVASLVMMFQHKQDEFLIFYWPVRTCGLSLWFSKLENSLESKPSRGQENCTRKSCSNQSPLENHNPTRKSKTKLQKP